jgi:hypothetical protein
MIFIAESMDQLGRIVDFSDDNDPWPKQSLDEIASVVRQLSTTAGEFRIYDFMQLFLKVLPIGHHYDFKRKNLPFTLFRACSNFDKLNRGMQCNDVVALTEKFAVACYRGQLDDVKRLSHVVRDDVNMLHIGLHFALFQSFGRNREHWDIIKWLMENTKLRDNLLVLRHVLFEACDDNKFEVVRWMVQFKELTQDTETINKVVRHACSRCHVAVVKCLVKHTDVNNRRVDTLLHDVIWMSDKFESELHNICLHSKVDVSEQCTDW